MVQVIEDLKSFYNSMTGFDKDEIILVIYDDLTNTIQYYQNTVRGAKIVIANQINYMYFPSRMRYGILTPEGYEQLMSGIATLVSISNPSKVMTQLGKLETSFYQVPDGNGQFNPGPQLIKKLRFITFSNSIIRWFILRTFSQSSKLLLKKIRYDRKHKDDGLDKIFKDQIEENNKPKIKTENLNKR